METVAPATSSRQFEGAFRDLPRKALSRYRKGQIIFDEQHPPNGLHLVLDGRVMVEGASEALVDIFSADDFLGESSLLGSLHHSGRALALDDVSLMSWTAREIEEQAERHPKLGIAFIQVFVRRGLDYQARLQSFALDKTPTRVVRSLLHFADRMGTRTDDGSVAIPPLTHQLLAQYVGTTREIITLQMNHLRSQGWLRYSRKGIQIDAKALREFLHLPAARAPGVPPPPTVSTEPPL
jgi:CRP-like cAMP-binding protein